MLSPSTINLSVVKIMKTAEERNAWPNITRDIPWCSAASKDYRENGMQNKYNYAVFTGYFNEKYIFINLKI